MRLEDSGGGRRRTERSEKDRGGRKMAVETGRLEQVVEGEEAGEGQRRVKKVGLGRRTTEDKEIRRRRNKARGSRKKTEEA